MKDLSCGTSILAGRWTGSNKGVNCVVCWSAMGIVEKKKAEQDSGHRKCRGKGQDALSIKGSLIMFFMHSHFM